MPNDTMPRPIDLLTFGDPNLDLVFAVEQAPRADEKRLGRRLGRFAGGTGSNVACAAAHLGLKVAAYGRVGDEADGRFLMREFETLGVATEYVRPVPNQASSTAMIMIEPSGEKALVFAPMPGPLIEAASLEPALARSRMVYATPYDLTELEGLSRRVRAIGTLVALDMEAAGSPDHRRLQAMLPHADLVFFNEPIFEQASGLSPTFENMRRLLDDGPRVVIVTRGAEGARAVTRSETAEHPAFPADLVDTTGAGDCFAGAFLAAEREGLALHVSLRFACAAASLAVSAVGARAALPDRAAVARLLSRPFVV